MNKQRLLDVARACREARVPGKFSMENFANECGTPACALGHYADRRDLQDRFELKRSGYHNKPWLFFDGHPSGYHSDDVLEWFGINDDEAEELFAAEGCGGGETCEYDEDGDPVIRYVTNHLEAAEYIEDFVRRHEVQP